MRSDSKTAWSNDRLQKLFDHYNKRYWNGRLAAYTVFLTTERKGGHCDKANRRIFLNVGGLRSDREVRILLLHEMAHGAADVGHGKRWQAELQRLIRAGASELQGELNLYRRPDQITRGDIINEFGDAAWEVNWRTALSSIGRENGLIDSAGNPTSREAAQIIAEGRKAYCRRRREFREFKMANALANLRHHGDQAQLHEPCRKLGKAKAERLKARILARFEAARATPSKAAESEALAGENREE